MSAVTAHASVRPAQRWRSVRFPVIVLALAAVVVVGLAALGSSPATRPLDPTSAAPSGARALVSLLRERGVAVTSGTTVAPGGADTVVLTDPAAEPAAGLGTLAASRSTVLLLRPGLRELSAFGVPARVDDTIPSSVLSPQCPLPAAVVAGPVTVAGDVYRIRGGATGCYGDRGDRALVTATRPSGGRTIVLGSPATLTNDRLAEQGNAALALGLLDVARVRWVFPGVAAPVSGPRHGLIALLPSRVTWGVLQLFLAVVAVALWRGRRLGAPVPEPLPVIVRAAETVEGHARLLHAVRGRAAAAAALRGAAVRRLAAALHLGASPDPDALTALAAARTGRPAAELREVLYGADPPDDAALVRLAQRLPALESEVRQEGAS